MLWNRLSCLVSGRNDRQGDWTHANGTGALLNELHFTLIPLRFFRSRWRRASTTTTTTTTAAAAARRRSCRRRRLPSWPNWRKQIGNGYAGCAGLHMYNKRVSNWRLIAATDVGSIVKRRHRQTRRC